MKIAQALPEPQYMKIFEELPIVVVPSHKGVIVIAWPRFDTSRRRGLISPQGIGYDQYTNRAE